MAKRKRENPRKFKPKVFRADAERRLVVDEYGKHWNYCLPNRHELRGRNILIRNGRVVCRRCANDRVIKYRKRRDDTKSAAVRRAIEEARKAAIAGDRPPRARDLAYIAELERRLLEAGGQLPKGWD